APSGRRVSAAGEVSGLSERLERSDVNIFMTHTATRAETLPGRRDPLEKPRIVFEPILEPSILGPEPDQDARWLAVTGDHDLTRLGLAQKARQVVLNLGEWNFSYSGLPNFSSHDEAFAFSTIANTSTDSPTIS